MRQQVIQCQTVDPNSFLRRD